MRFVSDAQRKAVFSNISGQFDQRKLNSDQEIKSQEQSQILLEACKRCGSPVRHNTACKNCGFPGHEIRAPKQPSLKTRTSQQSAPESLPGVQVGKEREEPEISQRYREVLEAMDRAEANRRMLKAKESQVSLSSSFQSGFQAASPPPSLPSSSVPQEGFAIPTGGLEEKYPYLMPFKELIPEVADVGRGAGQAVKGAVAGGALAGAAGIAAGMTTPQALRFGVLGAAGGAIPGVLTGARELTDIPAAAFVAGKEAVRIGLGQASPLLQTGGQLVQLGTLKFGDILLSPYTYGPSIHDMPGTMDYPPYYAKKPNDMKDGSQKRNKDGFTDDEIDAIKSSLATEFGNLKVSETKVNQYSPQGYKDVARRENPDQAIEAENSSAFYDPRADKLHLAIFGNKTQSLRSLVHDLSHSMGHFTDDPGLNEGMAEYLAVKIMKGMGFPNAKAEEQVGYKKEYEQIKGLVGKHGEDAVKQTFLCTHDSSDLATNMMFDDRIHKSSLSGIKPSGKSIIDFKETAKVNKQPSIVKGFGDASFNIDHMTSNNRGK